MPTLRAFRDHLWLWGHVAGSHNAQYGLPGPSRVTPAEAARDLGIPNVILVVLGGKPEPPFEPHAEALRPLRRVVWSIVGDSSSTRNDERTDLDEVLPLADRFPNLTGAMMDDFFHAPDPQGRVARYGVDDLAGFRQRLHAARRPLDLWVVVYTHQLGLPIADHLAQCDVVTLWTWRAADLPGLADRFARLESLAPRTRKVLGCYMWDYGASQPMPLDAFQRQCEAGLRWLDEGRIEGMIFLASCICDLGLDTVEWLRATLAAPEAGASAPRRA
jgi:hypothetical protein